MSRHAFEQRPDDRGLARADLAGELNEAACFVDAVKQMRERLGMPLAHEEVPRVRGDGERLFAQAEKARVHIDLRACRRAWDVHNATVRRGGGSSADFESPTS